MECHFKQKKDTNWKSAHLLSRIDTSTVKCVDVLTTFVHKAANKAVIAEDDGGHFSDVLTAVVLADVATVINQTGHKVALPLLLLGTFLNLDKSVTQECIV